MEPTSPAKPTRQSAANRRLSLLQSALDLFATQGYAGTTTKAVAERSGVTEALLFRHFRGKEELLRAVVEEFGPRRLFAPPSEAIHAAPACAAIEQFLTQFLDAFWNNRAFLRIAFTTPKRDQAIFADTWAEFGKQTLYLYTLILERSDRGELRPDIAAAATDILSAATSGFMVRSLNEEPNDWETACATFVDHLMQIVFQGVAVEKS